MFRTFDKQPTEDDIEAIVYKYDQQIAAIAAKLREPIVELPPDNEDPVKSQNDEEMEKAEEEAFLKVDMPLDDVKDEKLEAESN